MTTLGPAAEAGPRRTETEETVQQSLAAAPWRERLANFVRDPRFERAIIALIAVNAVILGLETSPEAMATAGELLRTLDRIILAVFVVEVALRMLAFGGRFFRDPWSLFDLTVVTIALIPASGPFSVLRALRALRALRLISAAPRMRRVVHALLAAIPGLGSIIALLALVFYVGAVIVTKLFGEAFPEWFGTLPRSLFSLFQIMTLESWSMGIVRPVMEASPYAWLFFVPFILVTTFTVLNLFIAVIVNAMNAQHEEDQKELEGAAHDEREAILEELKAVRAELRQLQHAVAQRHRGPTSD